MFRNPKRYIGIQATVEFFGNALLNGFIGWYWTEGLALVPLWGWLSIASDFAGTCFGIGLILSLIFTWRLHRRLNAGLTDPYPGPLSTTLRLLPRNPWIRSPLMGLGALMFAAVTVAVVREIGVDALARWDFIALKALLAGTVAFVTVALAGYSALGDGVAPDKPMRYWPSRRLGRT